MLGRGVRREGSRGMQRVIGRKVGDIIRMLVCCVLGEVMFSCHKDDDPRCTVRMMW